MARILLLDDEKVARTVYADFLTVAGHEVSTFSSLHDAKLAMAEQPFDAVVTDLILPEGDGMEVLEYTRETHPGTEVIVITALDKVAPAVRAIKSGAAEYLVKPVAPEALQHAVARALSARTLLRENESLRRYVELLEMGQRISTTLDHERLMHTALSAFSQLTGAAAVVIAGRPRDGQSVQSSQGVEADVEAQLAARARQLDPGQRPVKLADPPAPFQHAWAFPATEGGTTFGHAVLLFTGKPPPTALSAATFLGEHLALAWRNLGRFAEVEDLAYLDDHTRLFNMRYLDLVLEREVKAAQQTTTPFSLLFLDLDFFKTVNDTHGHLVGSRLLVEVGRILKSCVRDNDVVARYGGDEYVILLRATDSGGALKVAERIRRTVETHRFLAAESLTVQITTCVGVASFPEHATDKAALLDMADRAMYRGKRSTRNVVYIAAVNLEPTPSQRHSRLSETG
ncbi:MAG TPA: diguanylate cyclase [Myxococcales bacterium]|nr:diguanylate cyclase [Myxococcales bacterium]